MITYYSTKQIREKTTAYLASLNLPTYYWIEAKDDEFDLCIFLHKFSKEDIVGIMALKEKYGEYDYINHLIEYYQDPDLIHDIAPGCEILGIILDRPALYRHNLVCHSLHPDGTLHQSTIAPFLDMEYLVRLVSLCIEVPYISYNCIGDYDKDLASYLDGKIKDEICDEHMRITNPFPFLFTMDEAQKYAAEVKKLLVNEAD